MSDRSCAVSTVSEGLNGGSTNVVYRKTPITSASGIQSLPRRRCRRCQGPQDQTDGHQFQNNERPWFGGARSRA
jgi:hypothetical protein